MWLQRYERSHFPSTEDFARSPLYNQVTRSKLFRENTWISNKEKESIQLLQDG
jgi:hypothetical protein